MPIHDWQFWIVTAAALFGAVTVVRQMLPRQGAPACGNCAAGAAACSRPTPTSAGSAAAARISPLRVLRD